MIAVLSGALVSSVYGCCTVFRRKTPLFYRIVFFAVLTCLMGSVFTLLYGLLWRRSDTGFHVGYLGTVGMFFFLFSSYYGAIDSLADGRQPELRRFRVAAGIAAAVFFVGSALLMYLSGKAFWTYIVVIPMSFTVYFAMKHLIIPDVDLGIIKVMRPYNAVIVGLCVSMTLRMISRPGSVLETASGICTGVLLAVCVPAARNGVRKWFI